MGSKANNALTDSRNDNPAALVATVDNDKIETPIAAKIASLMATDRT
jgi:hypothetical protein